MAMGEPLTLGDALREALVHNPELRQEGYQRERVDQGRIVAAGVYDPVLQVGSDAGGSSSPSNSALDRTDRLITRSAGWTASLDQRLPSGGSASVGWTESHF